MLQSGHVPIYGLMARLDDAVILPNIYENTTLIRDALHVRGGHLLAPEWG